MLIDCDTCTCPRGVACSDCVDHRDPETRPVRRRRPVELDDAEQAAVGPTG